MIHHPSNTVIAKFSTWPDRADYASPTPTRSAARCTGNLAIASRPSRASPQATADRAAAATRSRPSCGQPSVTSRISSGVITSDSRSKPSGYVLRPAASAAPGPRPRLVASTIADAAGQRTRQPDATPARRRPRTSSRQSRQRSWRRGSPATLHWNRSAHRMAAPPNNVVRPNDQRPMGAAIDHRKQERRRSRCNQRRNIEPREPPAFELRQEVGRDHPVDSSPCAEQLCLLCSQLRR